MTKNSGIPGLFAALIDLGCLCEENIYKTADGFFAATVSVDDILACRGIMTVPGNDGDALDCGLFFDDWYLYAVTSETDYTYSLFKMREQEYDAEQGRIADGDIPGATVSFVAFDGDVLLDCLHEPDNKNRKRLNKEINRVVSSLDVKHNDALKRYFVRTEAQGPYLITKLYTSFIASLAVHGYVTVPECYKSQLETQKSVERIRRFIDENNLKAGRVICDQNKIYIIDPQNPTQQERMAILASYAGNTSYFSFAAEVQFHAKFLAWWAKIPIPFIGRSPYSSAVRADMSIGDSELVGPTPYYRPESRIVKEQYLCHKDNI